MITNSKFQDLVLHISINMVAAVGITDPLPADAAAHQASTFIEVDSETGSTFEDAAGDSTLSSSASLSSSVRDHSFEFGRRYHRYQDGKYAFPNDKPEQER